jgi:hypothetical protein
MKEKGEGDLFSGALVCLATGMCLDLDHLRCVAQLVEHSRRGKGEWIDFENLVINFLNVTHATESHRQIQLLP